MATPAATLAYRERFGDGFARTYFRRVGDLVVSSVGLGSRPGPATDAVDEAYRAAAVTALEHGCNVLDTAVGFRHQRSERALGAALADADVDRDAVFVASKAGFVPFDGERPADPGRFVREQYVDAGVLDAGDLVRGSHSLAPAFVADQFERSLGNLGVEELDCYSLQRPAVQLAERDPEAVYDALEAAFEVLERERAGGRLRHYGVSSWESLRVPPDHDRYLSLPAVVSRARSAAKSVGNASTGLRVLYVPFNVGMADAFTVESHEGPDGEKSALWFAADAGLNVLAAAPLARGDLTGPDALPASVSERLAGDTPAQRALNFARSAPGVASALVGSSDPGHVRDALAAGTFEPLGAEAFDLTFE